jgi:hypothetical protein
MSRAAVVPLLKRLSRLVGAAPWRFREGRRWPLLLAGSGWLTLVGVMILPAGSGLRVALVFSFALTCPGLAISLLLPIREGAVRWVLAVALSISIAVLVNTAFTVISIGSVALRLSVLALITMIAALVATVREAGEAVAASRVRRGRADK